MEIGKINFTEFENDYIHISIDEGITSIRIKPITGGSPSMREECYKNSMIEFYKIKEVLESLHVKINKELAE